MLLNPLGRTTPMISLSDLTHDKRKNNEKETGLELLKLEGRVQVARNYGATSDVTIDSHRKDRPPSNNKKIHDQTIFFSIVLIYNRVRK